VVFWIIAILSGFLTGVSKTGVPGVGMFVVALMASIFPARMSVGATLPMLISADVLATFMYRRHAQWLVLLRLLPWTAAGIALALWTLARVSDAALATLLGWLILGLVGIEVVRRRTGLGRIPHHPLVAAAAGTLTGFATTVGNVAGPVMNIYLIGKGYDKTAFMGTIAWFFFLVNLAKVPLFAGQGMITAETLRFDLAVLPAVIAGCVTGRIVMRHIPDRIFVGLILILSVVAAARLLIR
jgi:uncharacterized protein